MLRPSRAQPWDRALPTHKRMPEKGRIEIGFGYHIFNPILTSLAAGPRVTLLLSRDPSEDTEGSF